MDLCYGKIRRFLKTKKLYKKTLQLEKGHIASESRLALISKAMQEKLFIGEYKSLLERGESGRSSFTGCTKWWSVDRVHAPVLSYRWTSTKISLVAKTVSRSADLTILLSIKRLRSRWQAVRSRMHGRNIFLQGSVFRPKLWFAINRLP